MIQSIKFILMAFGFCISFMIAVWMLIGALYYADSWDDRLFRLLLTGAWTIVTTWDLYWLRVNR